MRWKYGPEILHVAGGTNTVAKAKRILDMFPMCRVSEDILKDLDDNDYIQGKHVYLTRVLSQLLQNNTDLSASVGKIFENIRRYCLLNNG